MVQRNVTEALVAEMRAMRFEDPAAYRAIMFLVRRQLAPRGREKINYRVDRRRRVD